MTELIKADAIPFAAMAAVRALADLLIEKEVVSKEEIASALDRAAAVEAAQMDDAWAPANEAAGHLLRLLAVHYRAP